MRRRSAPLLALEHVGKDYAKVETRGGQLRLVWDLLRGARRGARLSRARRRDASSCSRGESLGIIGENGAGKSTLLKIVAGVDRRPRAAASPSTAASARCSSSARASIPTTRGSRTSTSRRALLGLSPDEIAAKRDEIIAFADIGEHIHDPIKHYSSGMVVRLGFAVATALAPAHPHHRRSARGRRRVVPEEVHRLDGGLPRRRRHAAPVLAQHVPRPEALPPRAVAARRARRSATARRWT